MNNRSNLELILLTTSSFIGGVCLGLLLAPKSGKQSRRWISDHATELAHWIDDKGHETMTKSEKRLRNIRNKMHKGYKDTIPDLYEATENIDLNDSRLPGS